MSVVWEDPPPQARRNECASILAVVPRLQERPGQWARVHTGGASGVQRRIELLRDAGCETTTVRSEGGTRHLYARWPDGVV